MTARNFHYAVDVKTKDGEDNWRPCTSACRGTLGECIADAMLSVSYYQTQCEYDTRLDVVSTCAECDGDGWVFTKRRTKKNCPMCKGKNSTINLIENQVIKPMANYGTAEYQYH